jgi:hypothetical protein
MKMALRKNTPNEDPAATKSTPAAEPVTKTRLRKSTVAEPAPAPEPEIETVEAEEQASSAPSEGAGVEERAVSRPRPTAVATTGGLGLASPLDSLQNNIPPGELEFGSIPRYTASNGLIQDSDKNKIGTWMQFEPVSWNDLFMLAPGDNDAESKEYLKFSYDEVMCNDGSMTMAEALQAAKQADYKDAKVKKYIELFGILLSAEKLPENDGALGKMVMLSLSPQSVKLWNGFKIQSAVQVKMGRLQPEDLKLITAKVIVKDFGGNTFSCFDFEL